MLANGTGQTTDTWTYDAWGETTSRTGVTENDYLYAGERFDLNPQAKFLTCGKDRFCTLSVAPDGCKMRVGSTYATTHFILHKAIATCGFGL